MTMTKGTKAIIIICYILAITAAEIGLIISNHPVYFLSLSIISSIVLFFILWWFKWLNLDEKSLLQQPLFLTSILLPFHTFLIYGIWSWMGHGINFSSDGFANFIDITKLPLLLLASSVPLAAIVNNIHRTIQTEKQIMEAQQKNLQDFYINHRKFHLELYSKIEGKNIEEDIRETKRSHAISKIIINYKLYVKYPLELYRKSYDNPKPVNGNNLNINEDFLYELKCNWIEINKELRKVHKPENRNVRIISYIGLTKAYVKTCKHLCLGGYHSDNSFIFNDDDKNYQLWSIFFKFNTLYKCLLALETVTHSYLDTCYGEDVKKYFTLDDSLVKIGPGIYHDWLDFLEYVAQGDYSEAKLVDLSTHKVIETGDTLATED